MNTKSKQLLQVVTSLVVFLSILLFVATYIFWPYISRVARGVQEHAVATERIQSLYNRLAEVQAFNGEKLAARGLAVVPSSKDEADALLHKNFDVLRGYMEADRCMTLSSRDIPKVSADGGTIFSLEKEAYFQGDWQDCLLALYTASTAFEGPVEAVRMEVGANDTIIVSIVFVQLFMEADHE